MKTILFAILFILSTTISWGQNKIAYDSLYRVQGYLFIRTSPLQKDTSDFTKKDKITLNIDNPKFYFFKPFKSVSSSSFDSLLSIENQKDKELFLPIGLTEAERKIKQTNSDFKFYTGIDIESFNQVLKENESFSRTPKTVIKLKDNELQNTIYEVVYIDGIWTKVSIPFKFKDVISIGGYLSSQLDPNKKDGYDFYFLKEIKVISYNLNFNDESIIQLE